MSEFGVQLQLFELGPVKPPEVTPLLMKLGFLGIQQNVELETWPYVRVELDPGYQSHLSGTYITEPDRENSKKLRTIEGFLSFVGLVNREGFEPNKVLTIWQHITDDSSCIDIGASAVDRIDIFDENYAEIMAAYQNAEVDGSTYYYQAVRQMGMDVVLEKDELAYYADHPPRNFVRVT